MSKRIPDKNTDRKGYRRYYRDRHMKEELKLKLDMVNGVVKEMDPDDPSEKAWRTLAGDLHAALYEFSLHHQDTDYHTK